MIADILRSRLKAVTSGAGEADNRRAVIDIGSNTVRLVIYGGPPRAPEVLWNEKVSARLGRDLETTGQMPEAAIDEALAALARYALLVEALGIEHVETVATAAPREATNGAEFIARIAALGLKVQVLSGEEEARASAWGAIGAFPTARGLVADLGGGSLELVAVRNGTCGAGASYPLGTLRLAALRAGGRFERKVAKLLKPTVEDFAEERGLPLYMIGGTWRAFATYAMRRSDHPLTDPHGFILSADDAAEIARQVSASKPSQLSQIRGISSMRADKLPDAAALLLALLRHLAPEALVFSSWGLREGLHFCRLDRVEQAEDPLLAGVSDFVGEHGAGMADPALLSAWTVAAADGSTSKTETLRLAAAMLTARLHRVEPNLRAAQALEWALDKRWLGIDFAGRAMLAAALRASLGTTEPHERLLSLASEAQLRKATAWGLALRLAQRLGAGSRAALSAAQLSSRDDELVLTVNAGHAALIGASNTKDLGALANWLDLAPRVMVER